MLLPEPLCAATDEMLTMTASPVRCISGANGTDRGERSAHVGDEDRVDQFVGQRLQVGVRNHAGEAGAVHQHVAAVVFALHHRGEFAQRGGVLHRHPRGAMTAARQRGGQRIRLRGLLL